MAKKMHEAKKKKFVLSFKPLTCVMFKMENAVIWNKQFSPDCIKRFM